MIVLFPELSAGNCNIQRTVQMHLLHCCQCCRSCMCMCCAVFCCNATIIKWRMVCNSGRICPASLRPAQMQLDNGFSRNTHAFIGPDSAKQILLVWKRNVAILRHFCGYISFVEWTLKLGRCFGAEKSCCPATGV